MNQVNVGIIVAIVVAAVIFKYMMVLQKRKQDRADEVFEETMKMLDLKRKLMENKETPQKRKKNGRTQSKTNKNRK